MKYKAGQGRELCTESETRALIAAWGDQIQDNINISQRNADVYVDFAKAVTKQVFPGQDRKQCWTKAKQLKAKLKNYNDSCKKSGLPFPAQEKKIHEFMFLKN